MGAISCPIWNTPAALESGMIGNSALINSQRAGGRYKISGTAAAQLAHLSIKQKTAVTTWLVDRRRLGEPAPIINSESLAVATLTPLPNFSEARERFFRAMISVDYVPGNQINWQNDAYSVIDVQILIAWLGAQDDRQAHATLLLMAADGLLQQHASSFDLTARGFEAMESLKTSEAGSRQAFVAMWFDPSMREIWRTGFAPAIRDAGYEPFRIDGLEHNGKIDDAIVAEIKRSRFLVADFTCGGVMVNDQLVPSPRGGVYYEAGLAHGLGMEVIFTCRADRMDFLHFDTRQFAHIVWSSAADLRTALYNRIAATVREFPGAPGRGAGSVDALESISGEL